MGSTPSKNRKKEVLMKINVVAAMKSGKNHNEQNHNEQNHKEQNHKGQNKKERNHSSAIRQLSNNSESYNWSVHRKSIRTDGHRLSYGDTSIAWNALRRTFQKHQRKISRSSLKSLQKQSSTDSETDSAHSFYDNNPHLQYNAIRKIVRREECDICKVHDSRREPLHGCRVCPKIFHHVCLNNRGHLSDELAMAATAESNSIVGWSCPTCENLMNLLWDEEQTEVIEPFENMAGNATSIDVVNYLARRRSSYKDLIGIPMSTQREKQEISFFNQMDRNLSGTLEWWEYVPIMCIRILSRRSQEELLEMATLSEIERLESFFKRYDKNEDGFITLTAAKMAYGKWLLSLIKEKEDGIVPYEWIGDLPEEWISESSCSIHYTAKHKKEIIVSWTDFLSANSLHLISARLNTVSTKPFLPAIDDALRCLYAGKEIPFDEDIEEELETDPIEMIRMRLKKS